MTEIDQFADFSLRGGFDFLVTANWFQDLDGQLISPRVLAHWGHISTLHNLQTRRSIFCCSPETSFR
jgi:hypothetical protein